ncbi:hypothetical protein D9V34_03605 [Mycetocola lacteus]|uniref:Uncharacterized protein n=1 Tax=Mycetocola lacteus TaxID=76637 RepID=A0A3L7AUP8_9MICO|nr:hypothetical protein D9V34_03605 [Mycetocola lacteus]
MTVDSFVDQSLTLLTAPLKLHIDTATISPKRSRHMLQQSRLLTIPYLADFPVNLPIRSTLLYEAKEAL